MITGIIQRKTFPFIYHVNVNINLMEQNVIQINGGITINVNMSVIVEMQLWKFKIFSKCYG